MSLPRESMASLSESTRQGEPARAPKEGASPSRPALQRPSTQSHVWFAFDRWLSVEDQPGDDDFVLA